MRFFFLLFAWAAVASTAGADLSKYNRALLASHTKAAFARVGIQKPWPRVRVISDSNKTIRGLAASAEDESGNEFIYIREGQIRKGRGLLETLVHEVSHIQARREFGPDILEHGSEFKRVCRRAKIPKACTAIEGSIR